MRRLNRKAAYVQISEVPFDLPNINFKKKIVESYDGDTVLTLKKLVPVRLLKNKLYEKNITFNSISFNHGDG